VFCDLQCVREHKYRYLTCPHCPLLVGEMQVAWPPFVFYVFTIPKSELKRSDSMGFVAFTMLKEIGPESHMSKELTTPLTSLF